MQESQIVADTQNLRMKIVYITTRMTCLKYFFVLLVLLVGAIILGHFAFPEILEKPEIPQNIFSKWILTKSWKQEMHFQGFFSGIKVMITNEERFACILPIFLILSIHVSLYSRSKLSDFWQFFYAVILVQSCSDVHFKVFHLEMENTFEIKRQKNFEVRAMLMLFCFFLKLL